MSIMAYMNVLPKGYNIVGSACSGSDGEANRTYTLTDSNILADGFIIIVNGTSLHEGTGKDFTYSSSVVTFLNNIDDTDNIHIQFFAALSSATDSNVYCTHGDVSSFLQIAAFTASTAVTITDVEARILENEDAINDATNHSWKSKIVTDETHHIDGDYLTDVGIQIPLKNRTIADLDSGSGDSLKVWNGSEMEEWLDNKTEGRNNDFWVDYELGILFIRNSYFPKRFAVKITYRFGESEVPKNLKKLCMLMTAIDLIGSDDWSAIKPEGGDSIAMQTKVENWERQAESLIESFKEFKVIN